MHYDNNEDEDTTSLDAVSVSTAGGVSTQTKSTSKGLNQRDSGNDSINKLEQQMSDDIKSIDDKG